jgi:hypothetical protein
MPMLPRAAAELRTLRGGRPRGGTGTLGPHKPARRLEAGNLFRPCLRQRGDQDAEDIGAEQVLGAPQALCWGVRLDPHQVTFNNARVAKARQVRVASGRGIRSTSWPAVTTLRSAGPSKRHSRTSGWASRISVRLLQGHPPPRAQRPKDDSAPATRPSTTGRKGEVGAMAGVRSSPKGRQGSWRILDE